MGKNPKIHKIIGGIGHDTWTMCGLVVEPDFASFDDKDVTCKNCLREIAKEASCSTTPSG